MTIEKRRTFRVPCQERVTFSTCKTHTLKKSKTTQILRGKCSTGRMLDLSVGGMQLEVKENINPGELLRLVFELGQTKISTMARVVHVEKNIHSRRYLGLQFLYMTKGQRQIISDYVQKQLKNTYAPAPA
ncbi:MAG: PilZ domain-containing protein [Planctomycetota bacterium]|nr:MAG: PilZ domain-containing protein [Planctomycetota bacterium]